VVNFPPLGLCGPVHTGKTTLGFTMESIYNLVPVEVEVPVKPPLYRSRHDPKLADIAGSTIGKFFVRRAIELTVLSL